jgi:hypothetical protein
MRPGPSLTPLVVAVRPSDPPPRPSAAPPSPSSSWSWRDDVPASFPQQLKM